MCRCRFVREYAVPLITKSRLSFGEFTGGGSSPLCLLSLECGTSADGMGSPCCSLKDERVVVGTARILPPRFIGMCCFVAEAVIAWSCLGDRPAEECEPNRPVLSQPGPEGIVTADA